MLARHSIYGMTLLSKCEKLYVGRDFLGSEIHRRRRAVYVCTIVIVAKRFFNAFFNRKFFKMYRRIAHTCSKAIGMVLLVDWASDMQRNFVVHQSVMTNRAKNPLKSSFKSKLNILIGIPYFPTFLTTSSKVRFCDFVRFLGIL